VAGLSVEQNGGPAGIELTICFIYKNYEKRRIKSTKPPIKPPTLENLGIFATHLTFLSTLMARAARKIELFSAKVSPYGTSGSLGVYGLDASCQMLAKPLE
jgi:hypothetical protein